MAPPTMQELHAFYTYLDCCTLPPVHCRSYTSWSDVYNHTFRMGLDLRLKYNQSADSATVLSNMMRWRINHD